MNLIMGALASMCKDSLTEKETFIGLCLGCAGELGLDTSEGTPR